MSSPVCAEETSSPVDQEQQCSPPLKGINASTKDHKAPVCRRRTSSTAGEKKLQRQYNSIYWCFCSSNTSEDTMKAAYIIFELPIPKMTSWLPQRVLMA
jgi:hypothetical protein